jgi:hypothetical protein
MNHSLVNSQIADQLITYQLGSPAHANQNDWKIIRFEKIDSNWIHYSNILRAINYNIQHLTSYDYPHDKIEINNILNDILINISIIELYKLILNKKVNNIAINLINLTIIKYKPLKPIFNNLNGKILNYWTKFEYNKNSTILEFKKYYETFFNINIIMICANSTIIYADFVDNEINDLSNYNKKIITCISDDNDLEIPLIKINF